MGVILDLEGTAIRRLIPLYAGTALAPQPLRPMAIAAHGGLYVAYDCSSATSGILCAPKTGLRSMRVARLE
jgi:hypothetical protein